MAFERYILREGNDKAPSMSIHLLRALLEQYLTGSKNANQTKQAIEAHLDKALTANDTSDLVAVITHIQAGSDLFAKKNRMDEFYRILVCSKEGAYWTTRDTLRAQLNWNELD